MTHVLVAKHGRGTRLLAAVVRECRLQPPAAEP
jgi:hypothetical protein